MSTSTSSPVEQVTPGTDSPDDERWLHLFDPEALQFADTHRLACRAFCGVWDGPRKAASAGANVTVFEKPAEASEDGQTCPDCLAWWADHQGSEKARP